MHWSLFLSSLSFFAPYVDVCLFMFVICTMAQQIHIINTYISLYIYIYTFIYLFIHSKTLLMHIYICISIYMYIKRIHRYTLGVSWATIPPKSSAARAPRVITWAWLIIFILLFWISCTRGNIARQGSSSAIHWKWRAKLQNSNVDPPTHPTMKKTSPPCHFDSPTACFPVCQLILQSELQQRVQQAIVGI